MPLHVKYMHGPRTAEAIRLFVCWFWCLGKLQNRCVETKYYALSGLYFHPRYRLVNTPDVSYV